MKTIVFGAGYFGRNYIRELGGNLVAVVEPDKDKADFVRETYNVPVYPSLPTHVRYDAAIIVTPPDTHVRIAKPLLEEGHYVLVEKPLATSVEEALQLRKYRGKLMAGMVYLYHPEIQILKEIVKTTPINHIFTRRTNDGPVRPWLNALWDLAPHDVSIINYILGQKPIGVSCHQERDWAILNLEYVACQSCTYVSWLGAPKIRLVEIVPQEGNVRYIFDDMKITYPFPPLRLMLSSFLSGDWDERCSFESALDVLQVLELCR